MIRTYQGSVGLIVGLGAAVVTVFLSAATPKRAIFVLACLAFGALLTLSREKERWCLAALVLLIPVNINYFLFGLYANHIGGAVGLYIIPADLPLIALYLFWFLDRSSQASAARARMSRALLFFLPFLLLGGVSIVYSRNSAWAFYEWLRWVRFAFILAYFALRLPIRNLRFSLSILAVSVTLQSAIAVAQTALRSNLGMHYLGIAGRGSENVFVQAVGAAGSVVRGAGTTGHPNILGSFLVLTVSSLFLLATFGYGSARGWLFRGAVILGGLGLVASMSRSGWLSFALATLFALVLGVIARLLTLKQSLTIVAFATILTGMAALPVLPILAERVRDDLSESVELRLELNRSAARMAMDHFFVGVGLNNYTVAFEVYEPREAKRLEREWGSIPVVHNLYLLVWTEVGTIGLLAFLAFWVAVFAQGLRSLARLTLSERCLVVGILSGIFGILVFDLAGFALWVDAVIYTVAFVVGLMESVLASRSAGTDRLAPSKGSRPWATSSIQASVA